MATTNKPAADLVYRVGQHRRIGEHRPAVLPDRLRGPDPGRAVDPLVRPPQPPDQLAVEISDVLEPATGQEAGLQIAIGPLDEALGRLAAAMMLSRNRS